MNAKDKNKTAVNTLLKLLKKRGFAIISAQHADGSTNYDVSKVMIRHLANYSVGLWVQIDLFNDPAEIVIDYAAPANDAGSALDSAMREFTGGWTRVWKFTEK